MERANKDRQQKVLLVNGSPHRNGNTFTALSEVAKTLEEEGISSEIVHIGNRPVQGCIGSPVYFGGPSGSLCALLDRLFYSSGGLAQYKPAASVVVCRRGGATATFDRLNKYFTILNMPIVPSQYWNSVHGRNPGEALQDAEGLQTMRTLAHNMAWMLRNLRNSDTPTETEERIHTNFIR